MLSPDDVTQTGPIEQLPRSFDLRSAFSERRQHILQQKQTDALPTVPIETHGMKNVFRQVLLLRGENKRLRAELEGLREERQRLVTEYTALQEDLHHSFGTAVEEEAEKLVLSATQTLELSLDETPPLLASVKKTIKLHAQQVEDVQLVETLYLKGEVQRMSQILQQERRQIDDERQTLIVMRNSIREQARLRYKTIDTHLRVRWKASFAFATILLLLLYMVLQFVFLAIFHVAMGAILDLSLFGPIIVCSLITLALVHPLALFKGLYESVPHKKKAK